MSKTFKIAVSWEMCAEIEISADTIEEALQKAQDDTISLPLDAHYIDGSWEVDESMSKHLNNIEDE